MKEKLLQALKQAYAPLGLGDTFLSGLAEMLAGTNLVTEANMESIVAAQKDYLTNVQKSNDKRVQDAVGKVQKEVEDKNKALDELKKQMEKTTVEDKNIPEWYKQEKAERDKREQELQAQLKTLTEAREAVEKEKAQRAANERRQSIAAKAKEKGIPEWLVAHGFADIADDATDEQVDSILNGYAQEVKTNFLPNKGGSPRFDGTKATKADTDEMVKNLIL